MRLGIYPCKLKEGTRARTLYENQEIVYERHRHRYEVSNEFRPQMEAAGLVISGTSPDDRLVEIIELKITPTLPPPRPIRNSRAARTGPTPSSTVLWKLP